MKRFFIPLVMLLAVITSCDDTTDGVGVTLTDVSDKIDIASATFNVKSESVLVDSVLSRSSIGYLGKVKDPETGAYITSNFSTQFHTLPNYHFPEADSIASKINGNVIADSAEVIVYFSSHYGDTLSSMKCVLHELDKPFEETKSLFSSFSPMKEGYVREGGIHKQKTYTLTDYSISDQERESTIPNFHIGLNEPYTDKDGKTYNNYGTYIMHKYYENPDFFKNTQTFIKNVCPGFYIESTSGLGCMAYIDLTQLNIYFDYMQGDSIYHGVASFAGTEEVLQRTNIVQDKNSMKKLIEDETCTYIKSPSGIFTQLTLPVNDILKGHENDTLNTARMTILRENNTITGDYVLPTPNTLLIIATDSIDSFFKENKIADSRNTFISTLNTNNNSYSFGNISTLIRTMDAKRNAYIKTHPGTTEAEYETLFPNWNKATLIPVNTSYANISSSQVLSRVTNDMSLSCTRLIGGKANPDAIKIDVIYSKFK